MTRPKNRTAAESRERILQTATELFSQKGYSAAGVDDLAARSGIAKTGIYYHFGSKEGLLAAVLDHTTTIWIDAIRGAAQQAGSPLERLDHALTGMRAMLEEKPWVMKLIQLLALEVADEKPEIRTVLQRIIQRARTAIIAGMHDAFGFDLPDAEIIAGVILAVYDGIAFGRHIAPDLVPLDVAFEEFRHIVMLLVAARLNPELLPSLTTGLPELLGGSS